MVKKNIEVLIIMMAFTLVTSGQSYQDQIFTDYFKMDGTGWNAADGTISLGLPDGRTLWMFGDSHVDQMVDSNNELPCLFNARNSLMVQDLNNNFTTLYDAAGIDVFTRQFIKVDGQSEVTYWPAGAFVQGNIAYLFWNRYDKNSSAPLGIEFKGMVIAEISLPDVQLVKITPLNNTELAYGMAVVTNESEGYHYIYGRKEDEIFTQPVVARCPVGSIYGTWEFYEGNDIWGDNADNHLPIADVVSTEYSIFSNNGKYYLLSQQLGFLQCGEGRDIYIYESQNPQGPFENPVVVYTIEDQFSGEYPKTYNAQAHPQFIVNDELLISYNVNKTCPGPCAEMPITSRYNADMYRPKFARVPFSMFATSTVTSISENDDLDIFPNPTDHTLYLKSSNSAMVNYEYQILTTFGRESQVGITDADGSIKLHNLTSGIYFLKLNIGQRSITRKIVKL